jgi:hypothetical protein
VSKQPGVRNNGLRNPNSLSIVNEVECIQWLKNCLDILDLTTWRPPYKFEYPNGWDYERFEMPPDFAPKIIFNGVEELRFEPGWGDSTNVNHWTYAYLWWLKGIQSINVSNLIENLESLYSGLVNRNIVIRNIPVNKQVPIKVNLNEIKINGTDVNTFKGSVQMLNYITQKPMMLNLLIHVKQCKDNTAVIVEASPKNFNHILWKDLENLSENFNCNN